MKFLRILGYILFGIGMLLAAYLYILSFWLWYQLLGIIGIILAMFFLPDIALLIILIVQHGFLNFYLIYFVIATILDLIGISLMSAGKSDE